MKHSIHLRSLLHGITNTSLVSSCWIRLANYNQRDTVSVQH